MRVKHFKKECPSCQDFHFDDDAMTVCKWGKSKTPKLLITQKGGKIKPCNLKKEKNYERQA